jgi:hypothetical protein
MKNASWFVKAFFDIFIAWILVNGSEKIAMGYRRDLLLEFPAKALSADVLTAIAEPALLFFISVLFHEV